VAGSGLFVVYFLGDQRHGRPVPTRNRRLSSDLRGRGRDSLHHRYLPQRIRVPANPLKATSNSPNSRVPMLRRAGHIRRVDASKLTS
jgi:hypothetical protein